MGSASAISEADKWGCTNINKIGGAKSEISESPLPSLCYQTKTPRRSISPKFPPNSQFRRTPRRNARPASHSTARRLPRRRLVLAPSCPRPLLLRSPAGNLGTGESSGDRRGSRPAASSRRRRAARVVSTSGGAVRQEGTAPPSCCGDWPAAAALRSRSAAPAIKNAFISGHRRRPRRALSFPGARGLLRTRTVDCRGHRPSTPRPSPPRSPANRPERRPPRACSPGPLRVHAHCPPKPRLGDCFYPQGVRQAVMGNLSSRRMTATRRMPWLCR